MARLHETGSTQRSAAILVHVKRTDRQRPKDVVVIEHEGRVVQLDAWRHGILPHELVHAAVESVFGFAGFAGFVRLVARGRDPASIGPRDPDPEVVLAEALTNAFQYELWGLAERGNASVRTLLESFIPSSVRAARSISDLELDRCRALLDELGNRWLALAPGEGFVFELAL